MKYILTIVIAFISFLFGYYLSYFAVQDQLAQIQEIKNIVLTTLEESDAERKRDKFIETVTVESKILHSLINIDETGRPISIAIKDSARALTEAIDKSSPYINNISNKKEKERAIQLINNVKKELDEATFYYGK
jgi:hypothetical protein